MNKIKYLFIASISLVFLSNQASAMNNEDDGQEKSSGVHNYGAQVKAAYDAEEKSFKRKKCCCSCLLGSAAGTVCCGPFGVILGPIAVLFSYITYDGPDVTYNIKTGEWKKE